MASYFFIGIGGSGMLPLAEIVLARGAEVSGSDRSRDQGRTPEKFAALEDRGVRLFAQDGSGPRPDQIVVASAAIEASVPDLVAAEKLGLERLTRAELLAQLFNAATVRIAVGGTSGKSTVTGMIGWILDRAGCDPTIMNGAVMKNFGTGARIGHDEVFVSEVDESDGSIALYRPTIGVVTNIALDHKPLSELRALFSRFFTQAQESVGNFDDRESQEVMPASALTFGFEAGADIRASGMVLDPGGSRFIVEGEQIRLTVPGRHNIANALAAIAAVRAIGLPVAQAAAALLSYAGSNRRMDMIGTANGITVIDDFGHNPDKIAATLSTLHAFPGRLLVLFQPHGYGPLKVMGDALIASLTSNLAPGDVLLMPDPVYFGGTTDRSIGSAEIIAGVAAQGRQAEHLATRDECGDRLRELARSGDRVLVMGARDDTLTEFAHTLLTTLR